MIKKLYCIFKLDTILHYEFINIYTYMYNINIFNYIMHKTYKNKNKTKPCLSAIGCHCFNMTGSMFSLLAEYSPVRDTGRLQTVPVVAAAATRAQTALIHIDRGRRSPRRVMPRNFVCSEKQHPCPWSDGEPRLF